MSIQASKATLLDTIDDLLSVRSSSARQTAALANLEAVVARLAVDPAAPPLVDAFLRWQDSPSRNVAATLLEWLGRLIVRNDLSEESLLRETLGSDVLRALRLLQGVLLLHRPSQHFFARKSTHEKEVQILLALLELTRPNNPNTPLLGTPKPQPSPILFPPTPAASPSLPRESDSAHAHAEQPTQLALVVLDTLLCGLVDQPKNMRTFESAGGLGAIREVPALMSPSDGIYRIKVIEMLFFYLMPEITPTESSSSDLNPLAASHAATSTLDSNVLAHPEQLPDLLSGAADFIPQTPVKSRGRRPASSSRERRESPAQSSREGSPTRSPRPSKRADPRPSDWLLENATSSARPNGGQSDTPERRRTPSTPRGRPARDRRPEDLQNASATRAEVAQPPMQSALGHRRTQSAVADGPTPSLRPPEPRQRSSSSLDRTSEVVRTDMPPPPRPSSVRHPSSTARRTVSQPSAPQPVEQPSTPRAARERAGAGQLTASRSPYVRSKSEKKELLRQVMPNVDALEARFKAMGLEL
ncbi:hypothetical protein RHOSPDRAFT_36981 [Rhodotorula sp. JG-1b]|nr:hypothetical protein RHOSPDRAFT_36981 [Rhodotorula sp. JG-1b]